MAKRKDAGQAPDPSVQQPTFKEEQFINRYLVHGNAARASREAGFVTSGHRQNGYILLTKPYIAAAIAEGRAELRERAKIDRDELLEILIGIATAHQADFNRVLAAPTDDESYRGLGNKIHALAGAKKSAKYGNEIRLHDKMRAINELWDKLGFDKDTGERDRVPFLERLSSLGEKLGRGGQS